MRISKQKIWLVLINVSHLKPLNLIAVLYYQPLNVIILQSPLYLRLITGEYYHSDNLITLSGFYCTSKSSAMWKMHW